jgi:NADH-quinone oxidoreductase subunit F
VSTTYPQVLFQNRKPDRIATLEEYRQSGGYQALARFWNISEVQQIASMPPSKRGGPGSRPTRSGPLPKTPLSRYIITNIDEMEPERSRIESRPCGPL